MWTPQETPDLREVPIYHWVHTHKERPGVVCWVEVGQFRAVRVCAAGANEDGTDGRVGGEIEGKGVAEGYYFLYGACAAFFGGCWGGRVGFCFCGGGFCAGVGGDVD